MRGGRRGRKWRQFGVQPTRYVLPGRQRHFAPIRRHVAVRVFNIPLNQGGSGFVQVASQSHSQSRHISTAICVACAKSFDMNFNIIRLCQAHGGAQHQSHHHERESNCWNESHRVICRPVIYGRSPASSAKIAAWLNAPRRKHVSSNFSLGLCTRSSSKPNPTSKLSTPRMR